MPSFKINSHYSFLCCPGLKAKIFRSQYKWFPILICCLISSLVAMPALCSYVLWAAALFVGNQTNTRAPLQENKKDYRSDLWFHGYWCASSIQSCMCLEKPSKWCEVARCTGSVSPLICGTGKKAGHTRRTQLACFASINWKLLSLNLSPLNLSTISVEFHVFLKSIPAYCFSCRQLKKENGYMHLPDQL